MYLHPRIQQQGRAFTERCVLQRPIDIDARRHVNTAPRSVMPMLSGARSAAEKTPRVGQATPDPYLLGRFWKKQRIASRRTAMQTVMREVDDCGIRIALRAVVLPSNRSQKNDRESGNC